MDTRPRGGAAQRRKLEETHVFEPIRDLLNLYRFGWYHTYDSRRSNAGLPDILAWWPHPGGGSFWRELKYGTYELDPAQIVCVAGMRAAGLDVAVWNETDIRSGRVLRELLALRRARVTP